MRYVFISLRRDSGEAADKNTTDNVLRNLQDSLSVLSPELIPIHERLVNIRRQLVALAAKETAREVAAAHAHELAEDLKGKNVAANTSAESEPLRPRLLVGGLAPVYLSHGARAWYRVRKSVVGSPNLSMG